jgi:phosphocarrier protein
MSEIENKDKDKNIDEVIIRHKDEIDSEKNYQQTITLCNKYGLHIRAAEKLVRLVKSFQATVELKKDKRKANAKSIMDLVTLAAKKDQELIIYAQGKEAKQAMAAVVDLINNKFGEAE